MRRESNHTQHTAPVDAFELFERLTRLRVPHVNFGMLAQLPAGGKTATADVFVRVTLSAMSVWKKKTQTKN